MQEHRISGRIHLNRALVDQLSDKWTIPVLNTICDGTLRFNQIRRLLSGISQKSLTECLRKLERDGIVERRVVEATPLGTEYSVTDLGRTLQEPFSALYLWAEKYLPLVENARSRFDQRDVHS